MGGGVWWCVCVWWRGSIFGMLVREGLSGRVTCLGGQNEVNRPVSRLSVARILQEKEWRIQRPCGGTVCV